MIKKSISIIFALVCITIFLPKVENVYACSGGVRTVESGAGKCRASCSGTYAAPVDYTTQINGKKSVCTQVEYFSDNRCTRNGPNLCPAGCSSDSQCTGVGAHCVNGRLSAQILCTNGDSAGPHWCVGLQCGYDCKNNSCKARNAVRGGLGSYSSQASCQSSCKAPTPKPTQKPVITPPPPVICDKSISGTIFLDNTRSENPTDAGNPVLTSQMVIATEGNGSSKTSSSGTSGKYAFQNLCPGTIKISYTKSGSAASNNYEYPGVDARTGNQVYTVNVKDQKSCTQSIAPIPDSMGTTCSGSGSIANLNFALTQSIQISWFQSVCGDMRIDTQKPTDQLSTGSQAIIDSLGTISCLKKPGVLFSGTGSSWTLGDGSVSSTNWQVAHFYTPSAVKLSIAYLKDSAAQNNVTIIQSPQCRGGLCALSALEHGMYQVTGDVNIPATIIGKDIGNVIILVNGKVTIKGNITVTPGSSLIVASTDTITIDPSVTIIEGIFSAGKDILIPSLGGNSCPDSSLTVNGAVIANANRTGGVFQNTRALCSNQPPVSLVFRPDLLLNAPSFIKQRKGIWQEVTP